MTVIARIDEYACAGHGDCIQIAPEAFTLVDDVAVVTGNAPQALLVAAAKACPSVAITVLDDVTGEQIFP